jgi:16S rRNA (adenine1518-N6/adenine1519-N6)-dimethyltransferase
MPDPLSPAAALRGGGLKPRKRLGQNFLQDRSFLPRILDAASITPEDDVLEIGAGTGVLTGALAEVARSVLAVELDDGLHAMLSARFANVPTVHLWHGNILGFDPCEHFSGPYKLAANIPYYVTGPVIRHFLESRCPPVTMALMVQREVAERIVAAPPRLSLLALSVQFYAEAGIAARVPAGAFYPRPKVDSAIVRLAPRVPPPQDPTAFFTVARAGFGQRRKQIVNALAAGLGVSRDTSANLLLRAGIDVASRAEAVPMDAWLRLADVWRTVGEEQ